MPPSSCAPRLTTPAEIPLIDLSGWLAREPAAVGPVVEAVDRACRETGFFVVVGHGVDAGLMARAFAVSRGFFALPEAEKARIAIERSPCHRGWFGLGGENLDAARQRTGGDWKEGVKIGQDLPAAHPLVVAGIPLHGPNQWPERPADFRPVHAAYWHAMVALGRELMQVFALALGLPREHFAPLLQTPMATVGPLHYPPHGEAPDDGRLGAGAHTDFGCLTLLAQDEVGGLEVRLASGEWVAVPALPGAFVVNVGDMLARWTNDLYASTLHRVVNRSGRDRYSIPFFFDPDWNAPVQCLPGCTGPGRPARHAPTTALRHLEERIAASFAYR